MATNLWFFGRFFFRTQLSLIMAPNIKNKNPVIFGVVPMFKATKNEHVFQKVETSSLYLIISSWASISGYTYYISHVWFQFDWNFKQVSLQNKSGITSQIDRDPYLKSIGFHLLFLYPKRQQQQEQKFWRFTVYNVCQPCTYI